jgi:IS4 transposase
MRTRWQIELVFKLWKSEGRIDEWRSEKPFRILCELYAKLVVMIIQHWILLTSWQYPDRSLFKSVKTIRKHAMNLAMAFASVCSPLHGGT